MTGIFALIFLSINRLFRAICLVTDSMDCLSLIFHDISLKIRQVCLLCNLSGQVTAYIDIIKIKRQANKILRPIYVVLSFMSIKKPEIILLDSMWNILRCLYYCIHSERAYCGWGFANRVITPTRGQYWFVCFVLNIRLYYLANAPVVVLVKQPQRT